MQIATPCVDFHDILFRFETLEKAHGGVAALAEMSDEDRHVLSHYFSSLAIRLDKVCFQYSAGFLPDSYLASIRAGAVRFGPIWQELETLRPAELQAFMDRGRSRGPARHFPAAPLACGSRWRVSCPTRGGCDECPRGVPMRIRPVLFAA